MASGVNLPNVSQVLDIADDFGLELTQEDAESYCTLLQGAVKSYRRIDQMVEYRPPVKYPRSPGYRPAPEDNPCNGWYWKSRIEGAPNGPLRGKTVGVKDAICVAGVPMMNGSRILEGFMPDIDATVVTRLLDAGATILGKTNSEDCCFSGSGHTCAMGPVGNPYQPDHARYQSVLDQPPAQQSSIDNSWLRYKWDQLWSSHQIPPRYNRGEGQDRWCGRVVLVADQAVHRKFAPDRKSPLACLFPES